MLILGCVSVEFGKILDSLILYRAERRIYVDYLGLAVLGQG